VTGSGSISDWAWWRDRRPLAARLHLDSAAAGRSSRAILAATAAHAEREAETGGYVAAAEAEPKLAAGQAALGDLLGVPAAGLTFTPSGAGALGTLLDIWPLPEGATIAVAPSEWGPNLDAFGARGLRLALIPAPGDGTVDLAALERMLATARPAAVHLVQVISHRGLVQPIAAAAELCRAAGVPLWVDAAQAVGHVDTACGADAIYSTSRKWLTGPRGVGLLGVTEPWWDGLTVRTPQLYRSGQPADASPLRLLSITEANVAAWTGLCRAVGEYLETGPSLIWARLAEVGRQTREALADLPGWAVANPVDAPSAIVALRAASGQDVTAARARLLDEHGIVTTACTVLRAPLDMTEPLLRISPHVDLTPDDLTRLRQALLTLT
jgi:hercynylcysteine S-oxide lyase